MSCFFRVGGKDVWNPSNSVARMFVKQVHALAEVFELESGVSEIVDDESEISEECFKVFVEHLVRRHRESNNAPLRVLIEGVAGISIVLLDRASDYLSEMTPDTGRLWQDCTSRLASSMPWG